MASFSMAAESSTSVWSIVMTPKPEDTKKAPEPLNTLQSPVEARAALAVAFVVLEAAR